MKLLVVTSTFPRWDGDTDPTFVFELSRRLPGPDLEVHVLAPHAAGTRSRETLEGLRVHRFRYSLARWETLAYGGGILPRLRANRLNYLLIPFFVLGLGVACWRLIRTEKIDVVHAHWLIPQGLAAAAAIAFGGRRKPALVCTSHGGDLFGLRGALMTRLKRWTIGRSARLTVVSAYMREVVDALAPPQRETLVMPMGVDLATRFRPLPAVERDPAGLIFVGRLVDKKGVTHLVRALSAIVAKVGAARLTVVGDGPERAALEAEARTAGVSDRVRFLGARPQNALPALYSAASIAVVPSVIAASGDQEGLGLVTVEAMGCGCAVVASDLPAIRDVVSDGANGCLVEPGNPAALAATIVALLEDDARRQRLVAAAATTIDRFAWDTVAAGYRRLLMAAAG